MIADFVLNAVFANDELAVATALRDGTDPNASDSHGWSLLCWAAGRGASNVIRVLLKAGADVFRSGDDRRTPYMIAIAAGHIDAARLLADAEQAAGGDQAQISSERHLARPYCRAYLAREFRAFACWNEDDVDHEPLPAHLGNRPTTPIQDHDVLFLHRDLTVTRSPTHGEVVVFDAQPEGWSEFCREVLRFKPLDDFDWYNTVAEVR